MNHRLIFPGLALAAAMAAGQALPAPPGIHAVPIGQAIEAARSGVRDARTERVRSLAAAGKPAEAARELGELGADPALNDAARERLLRELILALADSEPDARLRAEIAELAAWQARTWVWTDEHGHRQEFPLYDVAAAAAFTERRWQEAAAANKATAAFEAGDAAALVARYVAGDAAQRRGLETAARAAPAASLAGLRDALAAGLAEGAPVGGLALIAARRSADAALLEAVLVHADPAVALAAVQGLGNDLHGDDLVSLLETASTRDDIASAALYRLGLLASGSPRATEILFTRLGTPGGETAAHALAASGDGGILDRLARILGDAGGEETRRRHALLGLRLAGDGRAARHLAAFAAAPGAPAGLVEEVPSWLRD